MCWRNLIVKICNRHLKQNELNNIAEGNVLTFYISFPSLIISRIFSWKHYRRWHLGHLKTGSDWVCCMKSKKIWILILYHSRPVVLSCSWPLISSQIIKPHYPCNCPGIYIFTCFINIFLKSLNRSHYYQKFIKLIYLFTHSFLFTIKHLFETLISLVSENSLQILKSWFLPLSSILQIQLPKSFQTTFKILSLLTSVLSQIYRNPSPCYFLKLSISSLLV